MSLLFVHARNLTFHSHDDGAEYDRPESALAVGVRGAIALLADEVNRGERSTAIEISVQQADGTQLLRSIVVISISPLMPIPR